MFYFLLHEPLPISFETTGFIVFSLGIKRTSRIEKMNWFLLNSECFFSFLSGSDS